MTPQRSNHFQRLVYLIKKHAAPGSTITESAMMRDLVSGQEREVDIRIQQTFADHLVTISLECRDWQRKQSIGWVDEMKAKHDRLPTDLLVLVSRSGFTDRAMTRAESSGIQLLTLQEEVDDTSIGRVIGHLQSLLAQLVSLRPNVVSIRMDANDIPAGEADTVRALPDHLVFRTDGSYWGTAKDLVTSFLSSPKLRDEMLPQGNESHTAFVVECRPPSGEDHLPFCLQANEPGVLCPITGMRIEGQFEIGSDEIQLERAKLGDARVVWGAGEVLGRKTLVVESEDASGEVAMSVAIDGCELHWQTAYSESPATLH